METPVRSFQYPSYNTKQLYSLLFAALENGNEATVNEVLKNLLLIGLDKDTIRTHVVKEPLHPGVIFDAEWDDEVTLEEVKASYITLISIALEDPL